MTRKSTSFLVLLLMSFFLLGATAAPSSNKSSSASSADQSSPEGVSNMKEIATENPSSPGTVSPSNEINGEISTDASFQIVLKESMTKEDLSAILIVKPAIDDLVFEGGETEWTLSHETPLREGIVYTFSFIDPTTKTRLDSYAFQTTSELTVRQVYPSSGSSNADANTGISMDFSLLGVKITDDQFEITPAVLGTFSTTNYRVTFIPDESLEESTLYSVVLKAGITSASGQVLETDYSWQFSTSDSSHYSDPFYIIGAFSESFIPEDPIVVEFSGNWVDDFQNVSASINVHQLVTTEDYFAIMQGEETGETQYSRSGKEDLYNTSELTEIASFQADGNRIDDYRLDFLFPDNLEKGWYIATIELKNDDESIGIVQKLLQISPIASYILSSQDETLIWLNNSDTRSAFSGLDVMVTDGKTDSDHTEPSGFQEGTTDDQGLLILPRTSTIQNGYVVVSKEGTPIFYETFSYSYTYTGSATNISNQFYSAIYTDRTLYYPTDTIRFWGYLRPKQSTTPLPNTLYAGIGTNSEILDSNEIQIDSEGVFSGEIQIESLSSMSSYSLFILDDEKNTYLSQSISVADFVKPAYLIDASFDKNLYYSDEEVTAEISVEYYDQTPVIDSTFSVSTGGSEREEVATDQAGKIAYTGNAWGATDDYYPSWIPTKDYLYVSNTSPGDSQVDGSFSYTVLPSKYAAQLSGTIDSLSVDTSTIDESAITTSTASTEYFYPTNFYEKYAKDAVDIPFTLVITKTTFIKEEKNSYYNPITQQTVAEYSYTPKESEKVVDGTTKDGKATLIDLGFDDEEDGYYSFELQFDGGVGQTVAQSLFNYPTYPESTTYNDYSLLPNDETSEYPASTPIPFTLDENKELSLYNNNEWVENDGNVLSVVYQQNFLKTNMYSGDSYTLKLDQSLIPNFSIAGAYFDGRHIYDASIKNDFVYDYSQQELDVSIDTGKGPYSPGKEIEATVRIKDLDGNPVSGVGALGVVDESLFSLSPQSIDLLSQLYKTTYYPSTMTTSYLERSPEGSDLILVAEHAAGSSDDATNSSSRSDFLDTAAFTSLTFNANGEATAMITLPDNITSWQFTAVAISGDLEAGSSTENVIITKDFYLRPLVTDTYLAGDDLSFSAIASGSSLDTPEDVLYSFSVQNEEGEFIVSKTASGRSSEYTNVNLGKLPAGSYTLQVDGVYGQYKDTVITPFAVVENTIYPYTIEEVSLADIPTTESGRYPVDVLVYSPSATTSVLTLASLYWSGGDHTENKVATYKAQQKFNKLFGNNFNALSPSFMTTLTSYDGGIKALPAGGSDVATTAKIAVLAPELLDAPTTISYFQTILDDENTNSNERTMALLGLATLDQPVLLDIKAALAEENLYTEVECLYLGAGLALLGDFDGANSVYKTYAETQLTSSKTGSYLKSDGNDATAAALLLTSITGQEDAPELVLYLNNLPESSSTQLSPYHLERLAYPLFYTNITESGSLTVDVKGETEEIDFEKTPIYSVSLLESTLSSSSFTSSTENVKAFIRYQSKETPVVDENINTDGYSIQKTYTPVSGEEGQVGSLTKVTLEVTVPTPTESTSYTFNDVIPSGYRYVYTETNNTESNNYFTNLYNEKQQIEATFYCQVDDDTTNSNFPIAELLEIEEDVSSKTSSSTVFSRTNSSLNDEDSIEETEGSTTISSTSSEYTSSSDSSTTSSSSGTSSSNASSSASTATYTIVYYISGTLPGEYVSESPILINSIGKIVAISDEEENVLVKSVISE